MASKHRHASEGNSRPRSVSPVPEYFVDLTVDSPLQRRPHHNTRRCGTVCNNARPSVLRLSQNAESSRGSVVRVVDADEVDCSNRLLPPKKRVRKDKTAEPEETINLTEGPQINDSVTGETTTLVCPICLDDLTSKRKPTSTRCGHIYCAECIDKTLSNSKKCPKCQSNITQKSCIRIYF